MSRLFDLRLIGGKDMMKKTMTRMMAALALVCAACCALAAPVSVWAASGIDMYRLYNRWTGEHFYTASAYERDSLSSVGWEYEGVGWTAPASGEPVYRLYNPYVSGGDHHYTTSAYERDALVAEGWSYEGVGWASGGSFPLYRQYNPYASTGTHNYTTSRYENNQLVSLGWREEGVGWYAVGEGWTFPPKEPSNPQQPSDPQPSVVYWTPGGSVWHSTIDCPSLGNSRDIRSGSIADAQAAGKSRQCKNCY